ncbi:MAG: NADH-quinone oxidoreductase subunit C [Acidimicrobiales bacterium]
MPSSDTETVEVAADPAREALLAQLVEGLGDAVLEHHLDPGHDLVVRVAPDAWATAAEYLHTHCRYRFFDWLSAIDWMPSPFGRSLDSEVDKLLGLAEAAEEAAAAEMQHGVAGGSTRFQMLARVYSLNDLLGITLKADVPDDTLSVPTWTKTYPGANWHEREASEMFGIGFDGHPGLRNLYLPLEFEGHPSAKTSHCWPAL